MICTLCNQNKLETDFGFRDKTKTKRKNQCRVCCNDRSKKHYQNNPDYYKKKAKAYRWRDKIQERKFEYLLQHPCVDCGESNPIVLEFDHINLDKELAIASSSSWNKIENEIAKCEVRCSNCHKIRHAKEDNTIMHQLYVTFASLV